MGLSKSTDAHWKAKNLLHAMGLIMTGLTEHEASKKIEEFDGWGRYEANLMEPFLTEDMSVLDFGGGIGRVAKHVAPLVKEVTVCDISQHMIDIGKNEWCNGIDNIKWERNDLHLPFQDNTFDFTYSLLCIWHLMVESGDVDYWFSEINRILKPGGIFYYDMDKEGGPCPDMELVTMFHKYQDGSKTICYIYKKVE